MTRRSTTNKKINRLLVLLLSCCFLFLSEQVLALEQMSDVEMEDIYAQNAADAQIATGPVSDVMFHYSNAIEPTSQAAGDLQTYLGGASTIGQFAGPPQAVQQAINDAQTVASGTTLGLGGI